MFSKIRVPELGMIPPEQDKNRIKIPRFGYRVEEIFRRLSSPQEVSDVWWLAIFLSLV